jgi:maltooligosyltrehalose trehalohydrolase
VRTGRRREFADHGWAEAEVPDPMSPDTVADSRLRWAELESPEHAELFETHRTLIALRRALPELADPRLSTVEVVVDEDERWLVLHRGSLRLACNLAAEPRLIPLDRPATAILLATGEAHRTGNAVHVPAQSFALART